MLTNIAAVGEAARRAVNEVTITDLHTHLWPPSHGDLLDWGVDKLLTYHYLVAELFTFAPKGLTPDAFWAMPVQQRADLVWEHVFIRGGALSEAARGVLTAMTSLGLDVGKRDLKSIRKWYAEQRIETFLPKVFEVAGLDYAVMTNDPFADAELPFLQQDLPCPDQLKTALRMDTLLVDWPAASKMMRKQGYKTAARPDARSFAQARKFLTHWAKKIRPEYMAASLPPTFAYPARGGIAALLDKVVIPVAKELGLPVALMIGVYRGINPALKGAGDGMGVSDVSAVQNLCRDNPDVKFLVTTLARSNQHELCVTGRKFGQNLHLFGCWWFCNNPSIIEEMTRMRLELLGTAVTLQHSDARVMDQLIYKWKHSRAVIGKVLAEKYAELFVAGWRPTEQEIRRDARALLGGSFEKFCQR